MLRFFSIIFCLFVALTSATIYAQSKNQIKRVIYITLDGVRWQDVYVDRTYFPRLWKTHAKQAIFYGLPNSNTTMEVASTPISLPSYQSQMAGSVQPCQENECGRVKVQTFPETLVKQFGLKKNDVATFSSWEVTDHALESVAGTTFSNNGTRNMTDPDTGIADSVMINLNDLQNRNYPGDDTRADAFTFLQAYHYIEKYQPRFMWISFGDADDYAHEGKLAEYHATLYANDEMLDSIIKLLKEKNLFDETMIIVTTDHGRGDNDWREHGDEFPGSKQTWAFVINGELISDKADGNTAHYSTLSIRPTVEAVFATQNSINTAKKS